jgi:TnpA family transposase
VATRDVFSAQELARLRGYGEITRAELVRYFTLTSADEGFLRKFTGPRNVLGASVQLGSLPWLGFVPDEVIAAPTAAVSRLADRLGIPAGQLAGYGERAQTRTDHLREIVRYLGWRQVDSPGWKELDEFLFARAMEHDSPKLLFHLACKFLISQRVVRPGVVHLLEHVATARERARQETWMLLAPQVSDPGRCAELDGLLAVDPAVGRTRLTWLQTGPTTSSPAAVKTELDKLAFLRGLDAHTLDLSMLPADRQRFLAGVGRRLTGQALARRDPQRRYPILLALLAQTATDVLDEVVLLFDQALSGRESAAQTRLSEMLAERARSGEDRQGLLDEILAIVLDGDTDDEQVGALLREGIGMPRMRAAWEARQQRLPRDHGHLAMLDASMSYLRQFAPAVLTAVRFAAGKVSRPPELKRDLLYVIIAEATNMSLAEVAAATGISYDALAWTAEWYFRAETLTAANTAVVDYHHRLPFARVFGTGTLASSDGQRFPVQGKSVTARHLSRYFARGAGISAYTAVSDQHATLDTKVIPANAPEGHFVLDAILGNTDPPILEHATDTHGASLANFALFDLVGKQLSPRIRGLGKITLCRWIGRQLNKGENIHALRRNLAYAHQGKLKRRYHEQQSEQMWCLTLATNAIVCWMTEYHGLAVAALRAAGRRIDDGLLVNRDRGEIPADPHHPRGPARRARPGDGGERRRARHRRRDPRTRRGVHRRVRRPRPGNAGPAPVHGALRADLVARLRLAGRRPDRPLAPP